MKLLYIFFILTGDTGPLVYPATFVYAYSVLYFLTDHGRNIRLAQYVFIAIYLLVMWLALRLYSKSRKIPPYVLVISAFTSYRIHSIFVLRLFNDPITMMFVYGALNLVLDGFWSLGSVCFSLAVGCKMNALLFAPALLLFYISNLGYWRTLQQLGLCALIQLIIGAPFLLTYPWSYLKGSFDLGRVFEHKWTVNYRFLPVNVFEHRSFHIGLLLLHIVLLSSIAHPCWKFFQNYTRLRQLQIQLQPQLQRQNNKLRLAKKQQKTDESQVSIHFEQCIQLALLPFLLCNYIGIICARSLHYQFYVWYFHSLPYLTWSTNYSLGLRYLLLGLIEFSWNTYPSTNFSSLILHLCHLLLLFGVMKHIYTTLYKTTNILQDQKSSIKSLKQSSGAKIK